MKASHRFKVRARSANANADIQLNRVAFELFIRHKLAPSYRFVPPHMGLIPASIQEKISKINGSSSPSSSSQHHKFVAQRRQKHNKEFVDFLANGWPGSTLNWTKEDLSDFSACFRPIHVKCGEEIPVSGKANDRLFFLVAAGGVEIHALVPTKSKKTDNVREFLAKKQKGDMVFMPSVRKLIGESNARETLERENRENRSPHSHKNVLDLIDTVGIKSVENSTLLQLDWPLFEAKFGPLAERPAGSKLDISMLRSVMQTNLTDYLSRIPILEEISFGKLEMLSRLCRYCVKKEGDVIFEEGDKGDEVYIILSGEVRVEALASKGVADIVRTEEDIARAEEGLEGLSGREMIIDESSVAHSISENDDHSSKSARKGSVVTGCDYMKGMRLSKGQEELQVRRRTLVAAGDKLRREAGHERLASGDVDTVELGKLGAGDSFGEMSCFVNLPRSGTVTAESNLLLATLSNASFRTLCKSLSPGLESTLEEKVKHYMLSNLFELKSPFQETIGTDEMHRMAENCSIVRYESGAVVFREGWAAEKFYFIYSGTLKVEKNAVDGKRDTVGSLFSGDYFGELALITGSARLATVRASSDAVLLEISADKFASCFASNGDLLAEFIFRIKGASVDLKSLLDCPFARDVFSHTDGINSSELALYDAITDYEKEFPEEGGMSLHVWKKAKDIVDRYLTAENKEHYVDLPGDATREARDRVAFDVDGEVERHTFQVPKQLLHERLTSTLDQLKNSAEFAALLKRMRCYDDIGTTS